MKFHIIITSPHSLTDALKGSRNGFDCTVDMVSPPKEGVSPEADIDRAFKRAQSHCPESVNVWVIEAFTYAGGIDTTDHLIASTTTKEGVVREGKGTIPHVCADCGFAHPEEALEVTDEMIQRGMQALVERLQKAGFKVGVVDDDGGVQTTGDKSTSN